MSKILFSLLLCLVFAFGADNNNTDQNDTNIVDITKQIQTLNAQIQILKAQQTDANSSVKSSNLDTLEKKKSRLLDKIPLSIMQIDVKQKDIDKFKLQKASLEKKVARYEKQDDKDLYIKNAIELEKMKIGESYFTTLVNLENIFKNGAKAGSIKDLIDTGLLNLQTNSYVSIKELKDSLGDNTNAYDSALSDLELQKETSEEILTYLKANAELLSSNLILSELNLTNAIEYINKLVPLNSAKFNTGKIVIIIVVFAFFVSLTRLLAKLTYWLMSLLTSLQESKDIKDQILDIIKKPITCLLIIYALNICIGIGFYPAPMPINTANVFSIIDIAGFTWLILAILDGYGTLLLGKIAQKSGRKEVVNLVLKIVYFIIIILALLMVLSRLGFDISALIASLGIGGLAVAFAAKDIIANFFASVMLLFDNAFSQGDWIVCGDIEGTVVEIGLRKTTVRSLDNALIFVPNSKLTSDPIKNWSRRKVGRNIKMTIGLTYDSKPPVILKCIDEIRQMLLEHPKISKSDNGGAFRAKDSRSRFKQNIVSIDDLAGYKSRLWVWLDKLNDSSIDININCFTKTIVGDEYVLVKQDIIFKIMDIVENNGLSFAFPSQSLYVENAGSNELQPILNNDKISKETV
ncbi:MULTISPECIES: mechanosensitive ion channel domain-containing protein [Campylobacter]|uniref:Mechanosensitive ion channel family protein n=1 Tax=Campylobacter curvus (strain 525.92) TaxID=360105 RepID=A7H141_CAMC5|nr:MULTISPECIES: mechanosensitive ion channel domain-containing protein [Campylobacter]EAU00838.1 mechanosensitive ion channel family protein [Campylobacter curvus 525.92]EJP75957.1 transporter, small conductance mechanosensitive ion channel MscS family protein [Campylobacter sp. FOBRC14]